MISHFFAIKTFPEFTPTRIPSVCAYLSAIRARPLVSLVGVRRVSPPYLFERLRSPNKPVALRCDTNDNQKNEVPVPSFPAFNGQLLGPDKLGDRLCLVFLRLCGQYARVDYVNSQFRHQ